MSFFIQYFQNRHISKKKLVGIFVFLVVFAIYAITLAKTHTSFADSDEMGLVGYQLGIAHAPGYPVYILIIYLFTHLIPFLSITIKANLTSAFFQALSAVLLYATSLELLKNVKLRGVEEKVKKKKYRLSYYLVSNEQYENAKIAISAIAAFMLAFSFLYWLYANTAEVFGLNDFFVILLVYLSVIITRLAFESTFERYDHLGKQEKNVFPQNNKKIFRLLLVMLAIAGISLTHLQTIVLIFPALFIYTLFILAKSCKLKLIFSFKRVVVLIGTFLIAFLLPIFLLIFFDHLHTNTSWSIGSSVNDIIAYITRRNYATSPGSSTSAYIQPLNASQAFGSIAPYSNSILNDFSFLPLFFAGVGILYVLLRNRRMLLYLLGLALPAGIFFVMYAKFPGIQADTVRYFGDIAILQRQFIMGDLLLALFIPLGMYGTFVFFLNMLSRFGKQGLTQYKEYIGLLAIVLLALIGLLIEYTGNYRQADLSHFTYIAQYDKASLESMDKNSVVICFSDISCFSLLYEQNINHTRPDVLIVPYTYAIREHYLDAQSDIQKFYYTNAPYNIADIMSWNIFRGRSVYISDIPQSYVTFLALDGQAYFLQPNLYVQKVVTTISPSYRLYNYDAVRNYIAYYNASLGGIKTKNIWSKTLVGFFTREIAINSYLYWEDGRINAAKHDANLSHVFNKDYEAKDHLQQVFDSYDTTTPLYHEGESINTSDQFYQLALQYKQSKPHASFLYTTWATYENPLNINARLLLAYLYQTSGKAYLDLARIEYRNVLKIDPGNVEAIRGLKSIS